MKTNNKTTSNPFSAQTKWEYVASGIFIRLLDNMNLSVLSSTMSKDVDNDKVQGLVTKFYNRVGCVNGKSAIPEKMYRGLVASGYNYSPSKFLSKGEVGSVSDGLYSLDTYEEAHALFFYLTQAGVPCSLASVLPEMIVKITMP